jgi:hypothetical protein
MRAAILSSFIAFELTQEEEIAAYDFNDCQIAGIQNEIAGYAEDILRVTVDLDELSVEAQKKLAYTKGCMASLKYLLTKADTIKEQKQAELQKD